MRTDRVQTSVLAIKGQALIPADQHIWRVSKCGDQNLGLACTEDGLFLGGTPLVERLGGFYAVRSKSDLERLLSRAYGADAGLDRLLPGLAAVASALGKNNLCLAQIAAVRLRLPDLPDVITRAGIEAEDLLIKRGRGDARFARATWDDAEHPRAGTAPNPGWFAPKSGPGEHKRPVQIGQRGRGEREPEDLLDPLGPVRQEMWDARISLLRRIDPDNPKLTYFSNPNSPPSQEALDRLDATIEAASIKRVTDKVMPGGMPIGRQGKGVDVRELPGGLDAAKALFDYVRVGGQVVEKPGLQGTLIRLPGKAGYITFRPISDSGSPAVDINIPGVPFDKIHFP